MSTLQYAIMLVTGDVISGRHIAKNWCTLWGGEKWVGAASRRLMTTCTHGGSWASGRIQDLDVTSMRSLDQHDILRLFIKSRDDPPAAADEIAEPAAAPSIYAQNTQQISLSAFYAHHRACKFKSTLTRHSRKLATLSLQRLRPVVVVTHYLFRKINPQTSALSSFFLARKHARQRNLKENKINCGWRLSVPPGVLEISMPAATGNFLLHQQPRGRRHRKVIELTSWPQAAAPGRAKL